MLYSFVGDNREEVLKKANALAKSLSAKKPNAEVFDVDGDFVDTENFREIVFGQGLFSKSYIVKLNNIFENKNSKETASSLWEDIKNSPNIFILKAGAVDAETKKLLKKYSDKIVEVKGGAEKKNSKTEFNIFSVSDKFGERDRRGLWLLYERALREGVSAEEVFWKIIWQLKTMAIASETSNPNEAEMKPFPYSKAKKYSGNFSRKEVSEMFSELDSLYHDVRLGKKEFETGLESFILSI